MGLFETTINFNKDVRQELVQALKGSTWKIQLLISLVVIVVLVTFGIVNSNWDLIVYPLIFMVIVILAQFLPSALVDTLVQMIKEQRKCGLPGVKSEEYSLVASFSSNKLEIKDALDYRRNTIVTLNYHSISLLRETENFFILYTKGFRRRYDIPINFGVINKISIEEDGKREEFFDFIRNNCPKVKFKLIEK